MDISVKPRYSNGTPDYFPSTCNYQRSQPDLHFYSKIILANMSDNYTVHYDAGITEVPTISVNKPVDLMALLSGHATGPRKRDFLLDQRGIRVPVESLRGKYVLICCFLYPILNHSSQAVICRAVSSLVSELPDKEKQNFQVLIVPKFRTGLEPLFETCFFHEFLSAFPDTCLIIPPEDYYSYDYVCKSLGLSTVYGEASLFVDPQQIVLQHHNMSDLIIKFGAAGFPFTESRINQLYDEDEIIKFRLDIIYKEHRMPYLQSQHQIDADKLSSSNPVSLEQLLECGSLFNIHTEDKMPVSFFRDKLVGLYIYYDGYIMKKLGEVLRECQFKGRSFEIVLICLDSLDHPYFIHRQALDGFREHQICPLKWWTFPFNRKVSQKLWRYCDFDMMDKLIIVPPPGDEYRSGDLQGKAVIRDFGGINAYPFTRETILERKLAALSSVTLESLLKEYDHVYRWGEKQGQGFKRPVARLRGKHILLYFDDFGKYTRGLYMYNKICSRYNQIRAVYPGSQVVFANINEETFDLKGEQVSKMPWLILPFFSPSLREQLQLGGSPCCVAFGKDGRVRSREAYNHLDNVGCLFNDHLRKEIVEELYQLNQDE